MAGEGTGRRVFHPGAALGRLLGPLGARFSRRLFSQEFLLGFARRLGPEATGAFLARSVAAGPAAADAKRAALCLYRLHFARDIAELNRRTERVRWIPLKIGPLSAARVLGWAQKAWCPDAVAQQMIFQIARGPEADAAREAATRFARVFLAELARRVPFDAVISANIDYWQDYGILRACREQGIPFLVLCREVQVKPEGAEKLADFYRGHGFRFEGDGVAVGSVHQAAGFVGGGVCDEGRIAVTGLPRFDAWRDADDAPAGEKRDRITLIWFGDPRYGAPDECREILRAMAATPPGDGAMFVKCKNRQDREEVLGFLKEIGAPEGRVETVVDLPMPDLFARSRLVIGFNSVALFEAAMATPEVCLPAWGAAARAGIGFVDPSDPVAARAMTFVGSREEMAGILRRAASEMPPPVPGEIREARVALFRRFYHFPERTTCCEEVEKFVLERIGAAPQGIGLVAAPEIARGTLFAPSPAPAG